MTETELDVDERRALLEKLRAVDEFRDVRLTWDSNRSDRPVAIEGLAVPHDRLRGTNDYLVLVVETDERKGSIYVKAREKFMENPWHAPIVAYSTGGRFTNRNPRLGELLDVEVLE